MATGGREGTRDDASPLAGEERGRLADGVLNSALSRAVAPRSVPQAAWDEAQAELKTLAAAGYQSIECKYGPMVVRGGYSRATFWLAKRAVISEPLLAAVRKYNGNDAAVARCPRTWGEARMIASGQVTAPSAVEVAQVAAASANATGMRHVPTLAGSGKFDDDRPLHHGAEWSALSIFSRADEPGSAAMLQQQKPNLLRDTLLMLDSAGQRIFVCQYAQEGGWHGGAATVAAFSPAGTGLTTAARVQDLRFWARQRPVNVPEDFLRLAGRGDANIPGVLLDLPVERCPGTYGEAMALVDGSDAAKATAREAAARSAGVAVAQRQSDAEDRAMLRDIETEIARLENGIEGLTPDAYRSAVSGPLKDKLNRVAGSAIARVRAIAPGANGRAAFDAWDRDHGGPLLQAVSRLFVVAKRKAFPLESGGLKLADLKKDQATVKREQQAWIVAARAQLYTRPIWHALVQAYDAREPLIDPAFIDKARRTALALPPAAPRAETTVTVTRTYFGTPGQIAAMKMVDDLGDAAMSLQQVKAAIAALHVRVGATRQAFWACYVRRCAEAGKLYAAYSAALLDKDYILLGQPAISRKIEQMVGTAGGTPPPLFQNGTLQGISAAMGSDGVDNGILLGCEATAAALETALDRQLRAVSILAAGDVLQKAFLTAEGTSEFREWQACRDRMEVLYRPRR